MTEDTKNKTPCPICGEMFDKRGLNGHIRKHKEPQKEGVNYQFDDIPQDTPEEEETDKLVCGACNTEIKQGVPTCPGCGGAFEW
ncbi:hypothetical protein [uncultured Methanolobus sp.]|uniref:hypothetical protein n=1 Tax=uncultured Methanolobus sp. TaxID=218300 RepID=UPI0029C60746|nr:hypothetical protein [uncultured Methanolobus sp.]